MNTDRLQRILISRTDAIGDVVLTLPVARVLKGRFPAATIGFLGRPYTQAVVEACSAVDQFVQLDEFLAPGYADNWDAIVHVFPEKRVAARAKQLGICERIGTTNRLFHWTTCNRLVRLSRKNSPLHETQLNLVLLRPFGIAELPSLQQLSTERWLDQQEALAPAHEALLDQTKKSVILHPRSQGSAREWGLEHFAELAKKLPAEEYQVFVSGTEKERESLNPLLEAAGSRVVDITGQMTLPQFIAFIAACDGLVAASTGPLHIAAALGKRAVGIYPPLRPMHAGRWGPIGERAVALTAPESCERCRRAGSCECMSSVGVDAVMQALGAL